ncbi:MAG: ABC transporter permease [Acidobacteriota bacterium]|nr:ABC transporter permease [Acidobacteriota bacterium]
MIRLGEIGRRLRALSGRSRMAQDLDEEMQLHLALRRDRLQEGPASGDGADVAARRRFGNLLRLREEAIDAWGWRWLDQLTQDVRFSVRTLARSPGFTFTAVCMLALGVGANTAVFSVVSGVVLRPLPFAEPDRLVQIYGTSPLTPERGALRNVEEYRRLSQSFALMAGSEVTARYLRNAEGLERVMTVRAERDFFGVLGVAPLRGRTFGSTDAPTVAVVSENFWNNRLGGNPSVIGSSLTIDDQPYTVVGVMPAWFQFPYGAASILTGVASEGRTDLWIPLNPPLGPRSQIGQVIGRLRPDIGVQAAESELAVIARRLESQYPDTNQGRGVRVVPLVEATVSSSVRRPLFVLFGAAGLLLALACSNVANLLLVRLTLRGREVAVRRALGAGRLRLVRQFMTESLLLSIAGGLAGLALAWWATTYVMQIAAARIPRAHEVGLDWRVFLFVLSVCTLIGLALGLAPALISGRRNPQVLLQRSGAHSTMGSGARRIRDALVVAEVALAFMLAVGAALLIRELVRLKHTDSGMVTKNVITFHVGNRVRSGADGHQFYEIADRVARLPGVRATGFVQMLPLQNWGWFSNSSDFRVRGRPMPPVFPIELRYVTPGYFQALGIPVLRGRPFTGEDRRESQPVILINEALARKSFPGENPLGKTTTRGTIVGIVGDVRQAGLDSLPLPEVYYPIAQNWSQVAELGLTLVVSTHDRPEGIIEPVRAVVREVNPNQAIFRVKTMDRVVAESLADFTVYLSLVAGAAMLALLLATTGTYAVISYIAASRTREFAIRVALGADRARVVRLVVQQGAWLTAIGLVLGIGGALGAARVLEGLPVSVRPPDFITAAPIAVLVAAVATAACLVPARRAAVKDPIAALRSD